MTNSDTSLAVAPWAKVLDIHSDQRILQIATGSQLFDPAQAITVSDDNAYFGSPLDGPFDRIVVTGGVAGISPHWLDQLKPHGALLAPVAHGGMYPMLAIRNSPAGPRARPLMSGAFPVSNGLLHPDALLLHASEQLVSGPATVRLPGDGLTLTEQEYHDLWFFLATRDARITRAYLNDETFDPGMGQCAKHEPAHGTAWIQRDGSIIAAGDRNTALAVVNLLLAQVTRWDKALKRPSLRQWHCVLDLDDMRSHPLWLPHRWQLANGAR